MINISSERLELFWSHVNFGPGLGPDKDCWEWTAGTKNKEGYGGFYLHEIDNSANTHKIAFCFAHNFGIRDIPSGIVVRHLCNNAYCVKYKHLALGTFKDNAQDMVDVGNSQKGGKNKKAKLNIDQVKEIRKIWDLGETNKSVIARQFNMSGSVIWQIVNNKTWYDPDYVVKQFDLTHKFNREIVNEIMREKSNGLSVDEICDKYGISKTQIYNRMRGDQRKND